MLRSGLSRRQTPPRGRSRAKQGKDRPGNATRARHVQAAALAISIRLAALPASEPSDDTRVCDKICNGQHQHASIKKQSPLVEVSRPAAVRVARAAAPGDRQPNLRVRLHRHLCVRTDRTGLGPACPLTWGNKKHNYGLVSWRSTEAMVVRGALIAGSGCCFYF